MFASPAALRERADEILSISHSQLGAQYVTREYLETVLDTDSKYFLMVSTRDAGEKPGGKTSVYHTAPHTLESPPTTLDRISEDHIIGFCIATLYTPEELDKYMKIPRKEYPPGLRTDGLVAAPREISVKATDQRRGVGSELSGLCMTLCEDAGADSICVVAWESSDGVQARGILQRLDFESHGMYPDYWLNHSVRHEYVCQTCSTPPCRCRAEIFTRQ